ncbi:efflux RND transporter periplasmic adaptor subunit [Mariniblastus fucicola]|uniref:Macrolide export protein MacA n=1 Tax=Mariniblastus fucicola TaxID=980251 RepID=A0A5B9P1Q5_9BACT|nr:HlyD family efflux transporter periplasmic adaptor subunit [Mariniblastus fucicola]QEG20437.1 Macrolide export protein MacA [Mariniblastus fucicola]
MKFSIQSIIWTVVFVAAIIVAVMAFRQNPVTVETAIVARADLQITVQEDGKTRIREKYIVSTPVAGRLSRIDLEPGDEICGERERVAVILPAEPAMLDARAKAQAESRLDQAKASLKRAEVTMQQAEVSYDLASTKLERAEKLKRSQAISDDEYDIARSEYLAQSHGKRAAAFDRDIAEYERKTAEAALLQYTEEDQLSGKPFELFAPVCGRVLRVFEESASTVGVGTPLIELGDPRNLEMVIDVLSTDAVRIRPGSQLVVNHWGGDQPLMGTVRVVEPAAFTKVSSLGVEEQRVNIVADFDETAEGRFELGDGFRVEAEITVAHLPNALQIPNSSLFRHQRKWHVFIVKDDYAILTQVEIGAQNETHTEVKSGLEPGDVVVLYPDDAIENESRVIVAGASGVE